MKMKNLKMSKKDRKGTEVQPASPDMPEYPWGLNIELDNESLKKLGINLEDYDLEDGICVHAHGYIKSKRESSSEHEGGDKNEERNLSIQLTDIGVVKAEDCEFGEEAEEDIGWDEEKHSVDKKLKDKGYD